MEKQEKKYNDTLVTMFQDDRWGVGNYLSAEIDAKAFDVIQSLGIGDKLLLKTTERTSKNGNAIAFIEIIKPRNNDTKAYYNKKAAAPASAPAKKQSRPSF